MARGKSIKTVIKEMRAVDPNIIYAHFKNESGEEWWPHVLYVQEFLLDSDMGQKWLKYTNWKKLEVNENRPECKVIEIEV